MNNKINIIIIDSGVKSEHKNFKNVKIQGFGFSEEGRNQDFEDEYGHGTAIFNIIKTCDKFANITNIKLKDIDKGVNNATLFSLLEYIYINEKADIINMSLGIDICENTMELESIIKKIASSGTIIISAFDNSGSISYPAAFNDVIGVVTGKYCNKVDDFEYIEDNIVNIAAKGKTQRVAWTKPDYILISGNSFACAHVTVQVAKFLTEGYVSKNEILNKFKELSIKQYILPQHRQTIKRLEINKAALFPFNKEMHSLIRYSHLLDFEIVDVYDSKYSGTIGATTSHLLKSNEVKNIIIKNINEIDWDKIDTLIIGHTDELSALLNNNNIKNQLINKALKLQKKVYSFDLLQNLEFANNIFFPKVDQNDLPANRCGMLYRASKPIVGIFGTSSKQGKFTLQLKLREILLKQGYKVGQIGTEPSSLLFGMDYCFPMGYNSSVTIKEFDMIRYLNDIINDLCIKDNDIILVGSQSGTIPYDIGNIAQFTTTQFNFLMGTQPDCVILCVNPYDDYEYIHRTIHFLESSTNCKVISIVVFPLDIRDDWTSIFSSKSPLEYDKYARIKSNLYAQFNIPVFKLDSEEDMNSLVEIVTDFFV